MLFMVQFRCDLTMMLLCVSTTKGCLLRGRLLRAHLLRGCLFRGCLLSKRLLKRCLLTGLSVKTMSLKRMSYPGVDIFPKAMPRRPGLSLKVFVHWEEFSSLNMTRDAIFPHVGLHYYLKI